MADFVVVLRRAVENLDPNTPETRAALYGKARAALLGQLRSLDPPLSEEELEAQTQALDQAIADTEREFAAGDEAESESGAAPEPGAEQGAQAGSAGPAASDKPAERSAPTPPPPSSPAQPAAPPASPAQPSPDAAKTPSAGPAPEDPHERFRSAVAESSRLGTASSTAARSARDALGHMDRDAAEPDPAAPAAPAAPATPPQPTPRPQPAPGPQSVSAPQREAATSNAAPRRRGGGDSSSEGRGAGIAVWLILLLVVAAVAGIGWWQRDALNEMVAALTTEQATDGEGTDTTKIDDRVPTAGGEQQSPDAPETQQAADQPPAASGEGGETPSLEDGERVAQAILVEETEAGSGNATTLGGSVDWELVEEPTPAGTTESVIRGTVRIPDENLSLALAVRRNNDPELPATHTVEILFDVPADFQGGGIQTVPGIIMKASPQSSGQPLVGAVVPVTDNFFLVGLSETDFDRRRNIDEMKRRAFIDIPLAYENGGRAVLSIAKGESGEDVFTRAFEAWGQ